MASRRNDHTIPLSPNGIGIAGGHFLLPPRRSPRIRSNGQANVAFMLETFELFICASETRKLGIRLEKCERLVTNCKVGAA